MKTTLLKSTSKYDFVINIRCNDECKNGHDSFAITAEVYKAGKKKTDRNMVMGGCCHEEILKVSKKLKPFIDLHLSDGDGVPMYAVENGFYFYQIMRGVAKYHEMSEGDELKYTKILQNHLRISDEELDALSRECARYGTEKEKKERFALFVESLKPRWKSEADSAKKLLAELMQEVSK